MKYITLFILLFASILLFSCNLFHNTTNDPITLQEWLAEKEVLDSLIKVSTHKDCLAFEKIVLQLKIKEFKKRTYSSLAKCYYRAGNLDKAKNYLLKDIASGLHISYIDSTEFSLIYADIKKKYPELHQKFWQDKDTSYFQPMEKRVKLDQELVGQYEKREQVIDENTKFLLSYVKENGFPWQPRSPRYFKKERFRINIEPGLMAIHADIKDKIVLREYAIESARKGKNSWHIPIGIGVTFYTQMSPSSVKPIRFVYFDSNNQLQLAKSYLQLHCIKKYAEWNHIVQIKIQPSKANSSSQKEIAKQLKGLKTSLQNQLSMDKVVIEISQTPNPNEMDLQSKGRYAYTFTNYFH